MAEKMQAAFVDGPGRLAVRETEVPRPGPGQAVIKVKAAGICGSDLGAFRGTNPLVTYPRLIGHELAGEVVEVHDGDSDAIRIGSRVVVEPYLYCGACYACQRGLTNCCVNMQVAGVHVDGGLAGFYAHPTRLLHRIPKSMSWDVAPLVEPLSIAHHAVEQACVERGQYVIVLGAGTIGNLAAQTVKAMGGTPVLVDPISSRLERARGIGIQHTSTETGPELEHYVRELTGGIMAAALIEASGNDKAVAQSPSLMAPGGRVVLVGWTKGAVALPVPTIIMKELIVCGSRNCRGSFPTSIRLIQERSIDVESIVTDRVKMEDVQTGMQALDANPAEHVKIMVELE